MSGLNLTVQTAELALSAATTKTLIQVIAAANHRVKIKGWGIYFDGTSVTGEPVQVELLRQSTAIGGTPTANNPVKDDPDATETVQTTAQIYGTSPTEPTAGDVLDMCEVHPQGSYEVKYGLGDEKVIKGGGRMGIRATAPAAVNARVKLFLEE